MYNHNKAEQSKNLVHISWDILYTGGTNRPMAWAYLWCLVYLHVSTLILAWAIKNMPTKMSNEIIHPFLKYDDAASWGLVTHEFVIMKMPTEISN